MNLGFDASPVLAPLVAALLPLVLCVLANAWVVGRAVKARRRRGKSAAPVYAGLAAGSAAFLVVQAILGLFGIPGPEHELYTLAWAAYALVTFVFAAAAAAVEVRGAAQREAA